MMRVMVLDPLPPQPMTAISVRRLGENLLELLIRLGGGYRRNGRLCGGRHGLLLLLPPLQRLIDHGLHWYNSNPGMWISVTLAVWTMDGVITLPSRSISSPADNLPKSGPFGTPRPTCLPGVEMEPPDDQAITFNSRILTFNNDFHTQVY